MPLASGARLGAYEVIELVGAGGIGEVYKARDTRLNRIVALKILADHTGADRTRRERFTREAQAVAALHHPHICSVYDVGEDQSLGFLVMEFLEGTTLADRLLRGPLPVAEALQHAAAIADALDHTHRCGLIHRDLKPSNVMLTTAGAKLLDFGLAKRHAEVDVPSLATRSSESVPLTADGAMLGTFPYMAPEQLEAREADARTDIFGLGAIIFEMVTGRPPFQGSTIASVIGAILHTDPPRVSSLQALAPVSLDRVVARCLARSPDDRWQTARDVAIELKWIAGLAETGPMAVATRVPARVGSVALLALALLLIAALAFPVANLLRAPGNTPVVRFSFLPPDGAAVADVTSGGAITISPDGQRVAFVATRDDGRQQLWVRALASLEAEALPGTEGAAYPFWSPDSRHLAFFAQGKLKRIPAAGGAVQVVCDAVGPRGGTWNRDGVMVFSAAVGRQLYRVPAGGGVAIVLPPDRTSPERYWPSFLPDGRHFLFYGRPTNWGIYVASLDSPGPARFLRQGVGAAYANGHLLVLLGASRGSVGGTLLAEPFDLARLQLVGEPSPVADRVEYQSLVARGAFSASENGTLVFSTRTRPATRLVWFDRAGKPVGVIDRSDGFTRPALSPDEKTLAVERIDFDTQQEDLWLVEATRGMAARLTSYPNFDLMPVWSPDGEWIVFTSARDAPPNLFRKPRAGDRAEELLLKSAQNDQPTDWSRDGRFIVYGSLDPITQWDVWLLPMGADGVPRAPVRFLQTEFNEHFGRVSPDGRWMAYVSDESGSNEVYVETFPVVGGKRRISVNGGSAPRWRGDGKELYYLSPDRKLMAVPLATGPDLRPGTAMELFRPRISRGTFGGAYWYDLKYTVRRDGQQFLIDALADEPEAAATTVVLNWPASLAPR